MRARPAAVMSTDGGGEVSAARRAGKRSTQGVQAHRRQSRRRELTRVASFLVDAGPRTPLVRDLPVLHTLYVLVEPRHPARPEIQVRLARGLAMVLVRMHVQRGRLPHSLQRVEQPD